MFNYIVISVMKEREKSYEIFSKMWWYAGGKSIPGKWNSLQEGSEARKSMVNPPTPSSHSVLKQRWTNHCPLNTSAMMPGLKLFPLPDLSLSITYLPPLLSVEISRLPFFPKGFFPWNLPWSGIYFTAVVPIWYLYSGIYLIIQLSMCELCEGKGYVLFSLLHFCYEKSQFGHSLLMWQSYNQIVVQWRQKLQWYQKRTSNWLTKRRLFEKSTMPNHKFMGFWTVSQDPGPFQASLELWTHCLDMKSKALNYITWFGHVG